MRRLKPRLGLYVLTFATVALFATLAQPSAMAQTGGAGEAMRVEFRQLSPDEPTPREFTSGRLAVFVGATHCTTVVFGDDEATLLLGTPDQPAGCRAAGAQVTFMNAWSRELFDRFHFAPGTVQEVINYAPQPPGSPLPGHMQSLRDGPAWPPPPAVVEVRAGEDDSAHLGALESLTVFVGEVPCQVVDLSTGRQPVAAVALLGLPEQPAACGVEGAPITFLTAAGERLVAERSFDRNLKVLRREQLETVPPGTPLPDFMQAFIDGGRELPPSPGFARVPAGRGIHLTSWTGGPIEHAPYLVHRARSFWTTVDGALVGYTPGAPAFVNGAFLARFPGGEVPPGTPMLVVIE